MSASAPFIPPRRSLALFAALAMFMVVLSYLVIFILAIACVYIPWLVIGNSANFQTLALFVAGVIVSASMLWSLVPRRIRFVPPGLLLDRSAHPRLFSEIEEIASALREPLPREVYLIAEPNAWVADRGGILGIGSWRIMGLGLPLLSAMNVSQFRAILAHEFAHYYGGDTRLGPWLRRAQVAMIRTFQTMGSAGKAMRIAIMQVFHMIVFGILKWYWLLFLRAINFVSRRQEFRADELACMVAGPESLVSGLQIVHGATLAWPAYWNQEVAPMLNAGFLPSIAVGFTQFMSAPFVSTRVKKEIETEIQTGQAQAFDSHPRLRDRIAAAQALPMKSLPHNSQPAWGLLNDEDAWDLAFLRTFNAEMPNNALKRVPWEEHATVVLIPAWTNFVAEYGSLLAGVTVQNLFESLGKVPQIAAEIRDPKGMLLSPEQRLERARSLLAMALGTALIQRGWVLHSRPGELYIEREGQRINPFLLIHRLSDGQITAEEWSAKSRELGIDDKSLGVAIGPRES